MKSKIESAHDKTPNFTQVSTGCMASLNRLAHDEEGIMTLSELERMQPGTLVKLGANEITMNQVSAVFM